MIKWLAAAFGVIVALGVIFYIHHQVIIDACLDYGGQYIAESKQCVDPESDYKHGLTPTPFMWLGYGLLLLVFPVLFNKILDSYWFVKKE